MRFRDYDWKHRFARGERNTLSHCCQDHAHVISRLLKATLLNTPPANLDFCPITPNITNTHAKVSLTNAFISMILGRFLQPVSVISTHHPRPVFARAGAFTNNIAESQCQTISLNGLSSRTQHFTYTHSALEIARIRGCCCTVVYINLQRAKTLTRGANKARRKKKER